MFSIYKEGIFSEKGLIDVHNKANKKVSKNALSAFDDFSALEGLFDAQVSSTTDGGEGEGEGEEKHHHKKSKKTSHA
jgi:hypothetical protein